MKYFAAAVDSQSQAQRYLMGNASIVSAYSLQDGRVGVIIETDEAVAEMNANRCGRRPPEEALKDSVPAAVEDLEANWRVQYG